MNIAAGNHLEPIKHNNNFGILRLILASLVIVSHSAEMIDGNRSREALMQLGGVITFGQFAVEGFFIVSGYLVLQSFQNSKSVLQYLFKRIRRIYPGFIACAIVVMVASPLLGAPIQNWSARDYLGAALSLAVLNWPDIHGFPGLTFHALNGSAWSIPYEFRCYLMVALLGILRVYRFRPAFLLLTLTLLVSQAVGWPTYIGPIAKLVGLPQLFIKMAAFFCVGSCFYLFRDVIRYHWFAAGLALTFLATSLLWPSVQETVFALAGGYLIFWFALALKSEGLARINSETDISYGTYLYAWPISGFLIFHFGINSPAILFFLTLPFSLIAGCMSWHLIEQKFLFLGTKQDSAPRSAEESAPTIVGAGQRTTDL